MSFAQAETAAKALFFVPNLSYSHVAFNTKLADTLVENGYDVVSPSKILEKLEDFLKNLYFSIHRILIYCINIIK